MNPQPQPPSHIPPGMDFHDAPAGPPPPGMDFGADHHDGGKHPVTELRHDYPLPGQDHLSLWNFQKADHPGHHETVPPPAPAPAPQPVPHHAPNVGPAAPTQSGHTAVYPADGGTPVTAADFRVISPHRQAVANDASAAPDHDAGAADARVKPLDLHTGGQPVDTQGNPVKTFNFKETPHPSDGRDPSTSSGTSTQDQHAGSSTNSVVGHGQPLGMDFGSPLTSAVGHHDPGAVASANHEGGTTGWADGGAGGPAELGPMPGV